jgi:hypothetical protein
MLSLKGESFIQASIDIRGIRLFEESWDLGGNSDVETMV